ncbi:MAG: anti-sigma factor antagonist [Calditrichae bacterium]|nr:STAS domain-containing protein [Calditrichia bacterium]NOQ97925.1 anti-sigma factor antagonist [Calditrichia bacterium]
MKISEKQVDDVIVLDLQGSLMGGPEAVSLNDAINRFLDQQSLKLVINLSSVERVNSSGLGILIKALTTFKTNGGELKLAHVNENMENLLAITKLNTILESYDTEDAAVKSFQ